MTPQVKSLLVAVLVTGSLLVSVVAVAVSMVTQSRYDAVRRDAQDQQSAIVALLRAADAQSKVNDALKQRGDTLSKAVLELLDVRTRSFADASP